MSRRIHATRAMLAAGALAALIAAGASPPAAMADETQGYGTHFDWGCQGHSYTEWSGAASVTGILAHEKWIKDGQRWIRATARRTSDGPKTSGSISHVWSGDRGRHNTISATHSWSNRPGILYSSTGSFWCP